MWLDGQKLEIEKDYLLSQCGNVTLERQRSQFPYCLEPKLQTCSVVVEKGVLMLQSESVFVGWLEHTQFCPAPSIVRSKLGCGFRTDLGPSFLPTSRNPIRTT